MTYMVVRLRNVCGRNRLKQQAIMAPSNFSQCARSSAAKYVRSVARPLFHLVFRKAVPISAWVGLMRRVGGLQGLHRRAPLRFFGVVPMRRRTCAGRVPLMCRSCARDRSTPH